MTEARQEELFKKVEEKMNEKIVNLELQLSKIQSNYANPAILSTINIDNYGESTPLHQLASITIPGGRQLLIKPYDKSIVKEICFAIRKNTFLGFDPINEGDKIRIKLPDLSLERRKELTKTVKGIGEQIKVAIRHIRHDFNKIIKIEETDEDDEKILLKEIQNYTNEFNNKIDSLIKIKEEELITI